jgi:hypothetical protein
VEERYDVWRNGARLAELLGNTPRKWYDDDHRNGSVFRSEERNVEELVEAPNDA